MIQLKDIPKEHMEKLLSAVADLRPDFRVRVVAEDPVLYKLGFVQYVPCTVEIDASDEEIRELLIEVYQMEAEAWGFDDRDLKKPEIAKIQKELEERYSKYAIIDGYLGH